MLIQRKHLWLGVLLIFTACNMKSPYKSEVIIFTLPRKEVVSQLHQQFEFENVDLSAVRLEINNKQTVDLNINLTNPKFKEKESAFVQKFAKSVKNYIKNINHFNFITVDTKILTSEYILGYKEKVNKTILDQATLNEVSAKEYFHISK